MPCSSFDGVLPTRLEALRRTLLPLPGHSPPLAGHRAAAVLILLFERRGELATLLTERPAGLSRHAGQISLPGGATEPGDANPWETAHRETREELGIDPGALIPIGRLPAVQVRVSRYTITPLVAYLPGVPEVHPDPAEVARVIEVSLRSLLDPGNVRSEMWDVRGTARLVTYYDISGHTIWGATARILSELAVRLGAGFDGSLPGSVE